MGMAVVSNAYARDPFQTVIPEPAPKDTGINGEGLYGDEVVEVVNSDEIAELQLNIQGVIWGIDEPKALIEGKLYKAKDIIDNTDARILKIEQNTVTVLYGGAMVVFQPDAVLE